MLRNPIELADSKTPLYTMTLKEYIGFLKVSVFQGLHETDPAKVHYIDDLFWIFRPGVGEPFRYAITFKDISEYEGEHKWVMQSVYWRYGYKTRSGIKKAARGTNTVAFEVESDWETKMELEEYMSRNLDIDVIDFKHANSEELLSAFLEFPLKNEEQYIREADRFIERELIPYLSSGTQRRNPIKKGTDSNGAYYQWGGQKRYYYDESNEHSRESAYNKARKQASAIFASGYQPRRNPRMVLDGMESRRSSASSDLSYNHLQEINDGKIIGFNQKVTYIQDSKGNELEFDIDDIEAVSMTPIDDMETDASCKLTFRPMISSDGEFHGNYLKTFDWWYE